MVRIGVRREDKNEWERRAPLTPDHVAELVEHHSLEIVVQPSSARAFPDKDYRTAGAGVEEGLCACRLVLGVKEIPADKLRADTTYLFFSHTSKGQKKNMAMLRRVIELGSTLIDYEHIRDCHGRRLICFGRFAGHAGMIDALWGLGRRLAIEGYATPFERIRLAHDYSGLDEATHHVSRIGERIRHEGLTRDLRPLVCAFTGSGNVARGAEEIFDRLPHVETHLDELPELERDPDRPRNVVYRVHIPRARRFRRIDGGSVELEELARHPERYRGGLEHHLPFLTLLVHGAYWCPPQPALLTIDDLRRHWLERGRRPLRVIADISCDIGGGIEPTVKATTPGDPAFVYDVSRGHAVDGIYGDGPTMLAVDHLPCQFPVESSAHFGDALARFLPSLARCRWDLPFEQLDLPKEIAPAVIVHRGRLTSGFDDLTSRTGRASA